MFGCAELQAYYLHSVCACAHILIVFTKKTLTDLIILRFRYWTYWCILLTLYLFCSGFSVDIFLVFFKMYISFSILYYWKQCVYTNWITCTQLQLIFKKNMWSCLSCISAQKNYFMLFLFEYVQRERERENRYDVFYKIQFQYRWCKNIIFWLLCS